MFKRLKERTFICIAFAFFFGLFAGINVSFMATAAESPHKYLNYFHRVYQVLRTEYVDVPDNKKMFFGAMKGMIKSLDDPFSRFLDETSFAQFKEVTTGKFVGVGIEISVRDGEVVVVTPIDGSPAFKAGIQSGDVITKVNDIVIKGKQLSEIVKLIKGLPKSTVKLSIRRAGYSELLQFDIVREPIKIKSVVSGVIKEKNIGYIKIKSFGSDTALDVRKALTSFNKKSISKVIVDLRYNPGGRLDAAIKICDLFLKKGEGIVSTKGRSGKKKTQVFKSENAPLYTGELIVLVNQGSASASEIFSGAMRDNKRGKLMGVKTFGKASVQKIYNLNKKLGIAVTIAKYYTPNGELIHKKGIKPDIEVKVKTLSKADKDAVLKINKLKLMEKFVKQGMVYNEETREKFKKYLASNNIKLTDNTAFFMLKQKVQQFIKRPLYDLEFDNQLNAALNRLGT